MTIIRETARPLHVGSSALGEHVDQGLALRAARLAAQQRAIDAVTTRRFTIPYEGGWMRVMSAVLPVLGIFGYKEFHLSQDKSVRYAVHVFAIEDGRPVGVVDAALVTTLRTAATAAVAAERYFGPSADVRLAVIGSGAEASAGVEALGSVMNVTDVRVMSRTPENREKLAADVAKKLGVATRAVAVPQQAAVGADLVYVATNSGGRVVLRHGQLGSARFVASIGSTLPEQRELDAGVLVAADHLILDTWDGLDESGDALAAAAVGLDRSRAMLLGNMPAGLRGRPGLTVYKSIGSPEQDLVLAHAILEDAAERGYGQPMEPLSAVKKNL